MNFIVLYHKAVKDLHEDDIFTTSTHYLLTAGDGEYAEYIFYSVLFKKKKPKSASLFDIFMFF